MWQHTKCSTRSPLFNNITGGSGEQRLLCSVTQRSPISLCCIREALVFPPGPSSCFPDRGAAAHTAEALGVRHSGSNPVSWLTPVTPALSFLISDLCLLMCNMVKVKITNGRWIGAQITWNWERWVSQEGDVNLERELQEKSQRVF